MLLSKETLGELRKLADEVATREGCRVYGIEVKGRILRIYIDRPQVGENVAISDCSNVSDALNLLLDAKDLIPGGRYDLEVSSPGLERQLSEPWHFEKAVGQKVRLKLKVNLSEVVPDVTGSKANKKAANGQLVGVSVETLELESEAIGKMMIPFAQIEQAHTVFEFGVSKKKPNSGGKNKKKAK